MSFQILYVEDNLLNIQLTQRMLKLTDYRLLYACDGNSGFEKALHIQPNLILMDINLPDVNGLDVICDLKQSPTLQHIPVVALTADASSEMYQRCMSSGCAAVLHKPVSRFLLVDTIRRFVLPAGQRALQNAGRPDALGSLRKVLIADDNPDLRAIFARTFDRRHFSVHLVPDGLQALHYLATDIPDVVILDVNMPHVSGLEVLRYLRENARTQATKVVLVTGNCATMQAPEAELADLLLLKPVNITDLITLAQRLIPTQNALC